MLIVKPKVIKQTRSKNKVISNQKNIKYINKLSESK